jgi:hypothetical protein
MTIVSVQALILAFENEKKSSGEQYVLAKS